MNRKYEDESGTLTTTSRLVAWYLTRIRGFRVRAHQQLPRMNAWGGIRYTTQWKLQRPRRQES